MRVGKTYPKHNQKARLQRAESKNPAELPQSLLM